MQEEKLIVVKPVGHPKVTAAMAYVPNQSFDKLLATDVAFQVGTIFSELYLPFTGKEPK